jgi:malate dehydrogenase
VDSTLVTNVTIWGNHSATQYPDFYNASIKGIPVPEVITDEAWLQGEFISTVQQRGAAIIKARGASSAASAANAVVDMVQSMIEPTPPNDWHSVALCSDGNYGVDAGLISSFPVTSNGSQIEVVQGVPVNDFSRARIDATVAELKEERSLVSDLLPA